MSEQPPVITSEIAIRFMDQHYQTDKKRNAFVETLPADVREQVRERLKQIGQQPAPALEGVALID